MKKAFLCLSLFLLCFFRVFSATEDQWASQLQSFLILKDYHAAKESVASALVEHPRSLKILELAIKVDARSGDDATMLRHFRDYQTVSGSDVYPRDILEEMAWGMIEKGSHSSAPLTRAIALIAAATGNDARGVKVLAENVDNQNRLIRLLTADFASHFRDAKLQDAILARLKIEKDPVVKIALIKAVGKMQLMQAEGELLALVANLRGSAEERGAAIGALVALNESVSREEVYRFVNSQRIGLRVLAAELIRFNERKEDADLLVPLLKDSHPEIRQSALQALGILRIKEINSIPLEEWLLPLKSDHDSNVAIQAAWAMMLHQPKTGQEWLKQWLKSDKKEERLFAAAALVNAGKYGFPLTLQAFNETEDDYVKLNLAQGLIQQRIRPEAGARALSEILNANSERWMVRELGIFEVIAPSDEAHRADIPNYPEAVNQTTRLSLLNQLAILEYPGTDAAIRRFLKERSWGVTGAAAALLLTEGDEEALVLIRELLQDSSEKVQLQAALILGLWGSDPEAMTTLQTLYPRVSRSQKEHILEALGKIGDIEALPFLVKCWEEPQQVLRMIAASAVLSTLYH